MAKSHKKSKRPPTTRPVTQSKPRPAAQSKKPRSSTKKTNRSINPDILAYNAALSAVDRSICDTLLRSIDQNLPNAENKIWHRHPVWFLDGNPIVGYHKLKDCIRLLFWSGRSFGEPALAPEGGFQTAGARYTNEDQISAKDLARWLKKSIDIQWDYKNIVKRKGKLLRLK